MPLAKYIQQLRGDDPPGEAAEMGRFLHERLQEGDVAYFNDPSRWRIEKDVRLDPIFGAETKIEETYGIMGSNEEITLVGKIDGISGRKLIDYKFTNNPDYSKYAESWQWRAYLMMLPTYSALQYEVFQYYKSRRAGSDVEFRNHYSFCMHPYPGMAEEVMAKLSEYVEFLRDLERHRYIAIGHTEFRGVSILSEKEMRRIGVEVVEPPREVAWGE